MEVDKKKRQETINKVCYEFRFLIEKNNEIVKKEIERLEKKYGKGQGVFISSYLIPKNPKSDDMYHLTQQLFEDKRRNYNGEFYEQMQKYWALINKLKENGEDFTIPYRIYIPTHDDFVSAFNSGLRKAGKFLNAIKY